MAQTQTISSPPKTGGMGGSTRLATPWGDVTNTTDVSEVHQLPDQDPFDRRFGLGVRAWWDMSISPICGAG